MPPIIFDYTNYRSFIKDYYDFKKSESKSFSYTAFAQKAGFKSKASLANITSGIQPLSKSRIFDIARAMKLNKKETEFFEILVSFNDAKTLDKRGYYFNQLQNIAQKNQIKNLTASQSDYYSEWYHCVIRELVTFFDFNGDYKQLAAMVNPPIKPSQAKESLELLLRLGLITKLENGSYQQSDALLSSNEKVHSVTLQKYHQQHMALAADSIDRFDRTLRNISSVTAGLSAKSLEQITQEINEFQQRILNIIEKEPISEVVYQIAFQLYPISKIPQNWSK